jgi:glycosyltransferase involved in cell wall biosynthesis
MNTVSIALFAHNEEAAIGAAIDAVTASAGPIADLQVHVLANGCTDRTVEVAQAAVRRDPRVVIHEIVVADKCNAWNAYVHELAPEAEIHVFMDGDMRCSERAVERTVAALRAKPEANALAGVPMSGRNRAEYVRIMTEWGWLFGCYYALQGRHLARIRVTGVRLPIGVFGDDHFVTRIARSSLDGDWDEAASRLLIDPEIGYVFDSLRPWSPRDLRLYLRRRVSYFLRQRQLDVLDAVPLRELPRDTRALDARLIETLRTDPRFAWSPWTRPAIRRLQARLARSAVAAG